MLPDLTASSRHAYVGQTGTGKSYAAKLAVAAWLKLPGSRAVVIDPLDEWSTAGERSKHVTLGPCEARATFAEVVADPSLLDRESGGLAVVVSDDEQEASEQVAELIALVRATGDTLLVCEECGHYAGPDVQSRSASRAMATLATRGRHVGVPMIFAAQRLVQVPPTARAQLDAAAVFRQVSPADMAALEDFAAVTGARHGDKLLSGAEVAGVVPRLPDRTCVVWTARGDAVPTNTKGKKSHGS